MAGESLTERLLCSRTRTSGLQNNPIFEGGRIKRARTALRGPSTDFIGGVRKGNRKKGGRKNLGCSYKRGAQNDSNTNSAEATVHSQKQREGQKKRYGDTTDYRGKKRLKTKGRSASAQKVGFPLKNKLNRRESGIRRPKVSTEREWRVGNSLL